MVAEQACKHGGERVVLWFNELSFLDDVFLRVLDGVPSFCPGAFANSSCAYPTVGDMSASPRSRWGCRRKRVAYHGGWE